MSGSIWKFQENIVTSNYTDIYMFSYIVGKYNFIDISSVSVYRISEFGCI